MRKIKKIFKNLRVIIVLVCLLLAIVAIRPDYYNTGVAIRNVVANSSANLAGIQSAKPNIAPMSREVINFINNKEIKNIEDYNEALKQIRINSTLQIRTNRETYKVIAREKTRTIQLNETELKTIEEVVETNDTINGSLTKINKTTTKKIRVPKTEIISLGVEDIGLRVYDAPNSNIRKGLDLQGGTRVLLQPEEKVSETDMENLISVMQERLNVYGLSDLVIRTAGDLSGNQYILVEIAGANEEEVKNLL